MITRTLKLSRDSYTQLTTAASFLIQNTSTDVLQIIVADSMPAPEANGINLKENEAITNSHIQGTIWGKGDCTVVIAEEAVAIN